MTQALHQHHATSHYIASHLPKAFWPPTPPCTEATAGLAWPGLAWSAGERRAGLCGPAGPGRWHTHSAPLTRQPALPEAQQQRGMGC